MRVFLPLLMIGVLFWLEPGACAPWSESSNEASPKARPVGKPADSWSNLQPVRKGEYICGDKICKLEPGVVPKGCNGMCQYPLGPPPLPMRRTRKTNENDSGNKSEKM